MTDEEAFDCGAYAARSWIPDVPSWGRLTAAWLSGWNAYFAMTEAEKAALMARKGVAR